jgi:hypothetical protein
LSIKGATGGIIMGPREEYELFEMKEAPDHLKIPHNEIVHIRFAYIIAYIMILFFIGVVTGFILGRII